MELLQLMDIIGIAAFSIAGALAAIEKRLDVFGIFIMAFVTALGGGTLRDILIGEVPVKWMFDLSQGLIVLLSAAAALLFINVIKNFQKILMFFDSIGLGFFTVLGVQIGIAHNLHPVICIALGTITACFGGVIRDIALNRIPLIFQKEIYATTCILGGIAFFILKEFNVLVIINEIICITSIVLIRLLAVRFNWQLPALKFPIYMNNKK